MKHTDPPPKPPDPDNPTDPAADSVADPATGPTSPSTSTPATPTAASAVAAGSEEGILDAMTQAADLLVMAETTQVYLAAQWGQSHLAEPVPEFLRTATRHGLTPEDDAWYQLSLIGLPYVDDFSIPSFAQAAKMTEYQARKLIRTSLVLTKLLPRVWGTAMAGQIKVFQAKKLAEECFDLSPAAIEYIDYEMAHPSARHTDTGRQNMITAAKHRYMADIAAQEAEAALESRDVVIDTRDTGTGLAHLYATLDLPAAIALEAALNHGAAFLKANGCSEPIGVRRGYALADLANHLTATAPATGAPATGAEGNRPTWDGSGLSPSQVQLFIHLTANATGGTNADGTPAPQRGEELGATARITGTGLPGEGIVINETMVRDWITRHRIGPATKVRITGVIDLNQEAHTTSYTATPRMKTQLYLRDKSCVFPFCAQTAHHGDCDHIQPWATDAAGNPIGGATCTCNLAKLCRRHHLIKTHGDTATNGTHTAWSYTALGDGNFLWTGPGGKELLRTQTETLAVPTTRNHTTTATDSRTGDNNRTWTLLEITETIAATHQKLWNEATQRFDKAINLATSNNAHYKKYHRKIPHPSHTNPIESTAHTNPMNFTTTGPVPF